MGISNPNMLVDISGCTFSGSVNGSCERIDDAMDEPMGVSERGEGKTNTQSVATIDRTAFPFCPAPSFQMGEKAQSLQLSSENNTPYLIFTSTPFAYSLLGESGL